MRGYIADSHVFLWLLVRPENLNPDIVQKVRYGSDPWFLSVASLWEICIKAALGKLRLPDRISGAPASGLIEAAGRAGLSVLPIAANHLDRLVALPPHHKDPFDRLLIVQATTEDLILVSRDGQFAAYTDVTVLKA